MKDRMAHCPTCGGKLEQCGDADRDIATCSKCGELVMDCVAVDLEGNA